MYKLLIFFFLLLLQGLHTAAQTLVNYGEYKIDAAEFIRSYNNYSEGDKTAGKVEEYLQFYVSARLKIQEAYARGYHKKPDIVSELENFRTELRMSDPKEIQIRLKEFLEGNIFFEIMQDEVWNKVAADQKGLMDFYEKNRNKYRWSKSVSAIRFYSNNEASLKEFYEEIKATPGKVPFIRDNEKEKIISDSGRFEWKNIEGLGDRVPKTGSITVPVLSSQDSTWSFSFIIGVFPDEAAKSFEEAKGEVIKDYQDPLKNVG